MPKKPFSNKQKKKQLQEKRQRRKVENERVLEVESESGNSGHPGDAAGPREQIGKLEPAKNKHWRKTQPKRYDLQFNEEKQAEIEARKQKAREQLEHVDQRQMEISFDMLQDNSKEITIPKRPSWNYEMSKEQVERQEAKMFRDYIQELYSSHDSEKLSYFEHNLETWRQLWRVLELSDIVVIITDVRHPILHFPMSLWHHITTEKRKRVITVLNKIDLVPPELVVAWKHYFKASFPDLVVVPFTSFPKDPEMMKPRPGKVLQKRRRKKGGYVAVGQRDLLSACKDLCPDKDLSEWEHLITEQELRKKQDTGYGDSSDDDEVTNDAAATTPVEENKDILTLGFVGHPNVGKSTVLNGLHGSKVVSASRTPGHTKYFQTIFLTSKVRLCDCPGLVFPAYIDKQLQILSGMYPIAQVREPYTSVGYLASRISLVELLKLTHPSLEEDTDTTQCEFTWSAWDICTAWALKRGFLTAKAGRPDVYRAANNLLRLTVDGRLSLCFYPPNYIENEEGWKHHPETALISKLQKSFTGVKVSTETWSDSSDQDRAPESSEEDEDVSDDEEKMPSESNKFALLAEDC